MEKKQHLKFQGMFSAVQFLTIIPCPSWHLFNARGALPYFPICGLFIGLIIVVVDSLAAAIWARPVAALIDIIALVLITGALHLDGLADTADGLYGQRKPEQALSIMKDSRIGAMGLVAVLCCFTLKWAGVANMASHQKLWLILVPAYARAAVLFGIKALPYGRPDGGTGHSFFSPPLQIIDFWGIVPLILLSFFTSWEFIKLNVVFVIIVAVTIAWYRRKINCITGDMLGAMIEITETGLFLMAASLWNY